MKSQWNFIGKNHCWHVGQKGRLMHSGEITHAFGEMPEAWEDLGQVRAFPPMGRL